MSKKIKPNKYKPVTKEGEILKSDSGIVIDFCIKCIMTVAFISILSLASIFIYDFITQSDFFNIKKVEISGTKRIFKDDILKLANLTGDENIYGLNLFTIEKLIASHPWIQSAYVKRNLSSVLSISIIEQKPLAIVKIKNLADILINTQGQPFKEYDPLKDHLKNLPIITGLDLTNTNNQYAFNGTLFNSIMNFLQTGESGNVRQINGDDRTGITIEANDIYNRLSSYEQGTVQIRLGFNNFKAKLKKAKKISDYIDKNFPTKTICAMDLFNIKKVFIKTKMNDALHNNLEKGV
ncbi:FtsQ-type POTRA domain-containing protein [Desulfobacula sp.]|uniref:cell division protein FtsQ/DivIB n=1 Tax=Desulfobacula sp. TaxID=2593537 RepID=UPI002620B710|nr:FtsQ-type POTRA domain-containing protein [Desulfobacula sp.]